MTINPISSSLAQSTAVVASSPNRSAAPQESAKPSSTASSPAATVSLSGRPAGVDADDQATYTQALTAARGNVNAAMAAVSSEDRKSGES
jgi:hypothetical protein